MTKEKETKNYIPCGRCGVDTYFSERPCSYDAPEYEVQIRERPIVPSVTKPKYIKNID